MDDDSPKYVKLISAAGTEVHCERAVAISASATMAAMLTSSMREAEENVVRLPDISGPILEKVVQVRRRDVVCGCFICAWVLKWAMGKYIGRECLGGYRSGGIICIMSGKRVVGSAYPR
jgi:hypothetical protein